jgi:hypothetical protein
MNRSWIALLLLPLVSGAASAAVVIDIDEVGANVVATASGTINTAGFDSQDGATPGPFVAGTAFAPDWTCGVGVGDSAAVDVYLEADLGTPGVCSTGARFAAGPSAGNYAGVIANSDGSGVIYVEPGYVSGSPIDAQSTWTNSSLGSLGLNPGVYVYTWGRGATADTLTVRIGQSPGPAPGPQPRPIPSMRAAGLVLLVMALLTIAWVRLRF